MTVPSAEDRERLLAELLAAERSAQDPEIAAILQGDPRLRAELASLLPLIERLNAAGVRERSILAGDPVAVESVAVESVAVASVAGEPVFAAGRPAAALGPAAATVNQFRRPWWVSLAAAAALLMLGLLYHFGKPGSSDDAGGMPDDLGTLSAEDLALDAPRSFDGKVQLRWRTAASVPFARFEAVIYDPAAGRDSPLLQRPVELESETTWTLDASQVQQFPAASRLRVVARLQGRVVVRERALR